MTFAGKAAYPPNGAGKHPHPDIRGDAVFADPAAALARVSPRPGQPKIAFVRWLETHAGKKPSDFRPLIKEAEFAWRCRSSFSGACDDLGGARNVERQLKNLELGLCCGWRVLEREEARSLRDWLDAVLPHHPWGAALDWRDSGACEALMRYCDEDGANAPEAEEARIIAAAGLAGALEQACAFTNWRDVQAVVLSAWLGGALLVDGDGYLVAGWKRALARTFVDRIVSLH